MWALVVLKMRQLRKARSFCTIQKENPLSCWIILITKIRNRTSRCFKTHLSAWHSAHNKSAHSWRTLPRRGWGRCMHAPVCMLLLQNRTSTWNWGIQTPSPAACQSVWKCVCQLEDSCLIRTDKAGADKRRDDGINDGNADSYLLLKLQVWELQGRGSSVLLMQHTGVWALNESRCIQYRPNIDYAARWMTCWERAFSHSGISAQFAGILPVRASSPAGSRGGEVW